MNGDVSMAITWEEDTEDARTMRLANSLVFEIRRRTFDELEWTFVLWLETAAKDRRIEITSWSVYSIGHIEDATKYGVGKLHDWLMGQLKYLA
jgi:hypothetical protein